MDYSEAIAAVENGVNGQPQYAYRSSWPLAQYIGLNGSTIYKYSSTPPGAPYAPTQADINGVDWAYNGDRPPR